MVHHGVDLDFYLNDHTDLVYYFLYTIACLAVKGAAHFQMVEALEKKFPIPTNHMPKCQNRY